MKKIINNKLYNTETATQICCSFTGNFNCKKTTLYKKKNGEFFEHHELNEFKYREWIIPINEKKARNFAEEELEYKEYIKFFGEVNE